MKKIFLFLVLLLSVLGASAQEKPLEFSEVIQAEGKSAQELYVIVKSWVATNFRSANAVIQMDDKESGVLIGKGNFDYRAPGGMSYRFIDGPVWFTLNIQTRDGRYKVTLNDFRHESREIKSWVKETWSFGQITDRPKFKTKGLQDKRWTKTWPDLQAKCEEHSLLTFEELKKATSGEKPVVDEKNQW